MPRPRPSGCHGGIVDLSIGTPFDPPPAAVVEALATSDAERGYPASIGSARVPRGGRGLDGSAGSASPSIPPTSPPASAPRSSWPRCRSGCACARPSATPCCTRRCPTRPTRWARRSPAAAPCPCPSTTSGGSTCRAISEDDAARALCLWVNTPGNPAGQLDDLGAAAAWGRAHGVPVFSDECYVEFTWDGRAAHDPGARARRRARRALAVEAVEPGRAAGGLLRRRPRAGALPRPRCASTSGIHGARARCRRPRPWRWTTTPTSRSSGPLPASGSSASGGSSPSSTCRAAARGRLLPVGAAPDGDAWAFTGRLARRRRRAREPGRVLRDRGPGHVRVALVQPMERLELVAERLGVG